MNSHYRGRFAPSPTGPLHFGSLIAATASFLQARAQGGEWLVRIEDIDPPREVPGASAEILRTLEAFGFEWDQTVVYQSQRTEHYEAALEVLKNQGVLFACACSRKEVTEQTNNGIYPGTCRNGLPAGRAPRSWRVRTDTQVIAYTDGIQGEIHTELAREVGDFILQRADGLFAYQLAVAVDDALQGITQVVRGVDLLGCTVQQIYLQRLLGFQSPRYAHHPIAINRNGQKLSKQNLAPALNIRQPVSELWQALRFLGQSPPPALKSASPTTLWSWAIEHWGLAKIPRETARQLEEITISSDS